MEAKLIVERVKVKIVLRAVDYIVFLHQTNFEDHLISDIIKT